MLSIPHNDNNESLCVNLLMLSFHSPRRRRANTTRIVRTLTPPCSMDELEFNPYDDFNLAQDDEEAAITSYAPPETEYSASHDHTLSACS